MIYRIFLISLLILVSRESVAGSSKDIACMAVMCLTGDGGESCAPALNKFFSIEKFTGGVTRSFSKRLTKKARKLFLKQCRAENIGPYINSAINSQGSERRTQQVIDRPDNDRGLRCRKKKKSTRCK